MKAEVTTVRQIISDHIQQLDGDRPVNVNEAMDLVRVQVPGCPLNDKELATLVGAIAIALRRNVRFEGVGIDLDNLGPP